MNYYNEFDPKAAAWIRELIAGGHMPDGFVDERSIADIDARELEGFDQCHFFAGICGWPLALKLAGWPSDRPVWTGSCPCQPFSVAGKGRGKADPRHLWPHFRRLIRQCRPPVVFGEQVASAAGRVWLSGVCSDLEALGYCTASADLCAAGGPEDCEIGIVRGDSPLEWERATLSAPHIRQRLFWVAGRMALTGPQSARRQLRRSREGAGESRQRTPDQLGGSGGTGGVGITDRSGREPRGIATTTAGHGHSIEPAGNVGGLALPNRGECARISDGEGCQCHGTQTGRQQGDCELEPCGESCGNRLEHPESHGRLERRTESGGRGAECGCGAGNGRVGDTIQPGLEGHPRYEHNGHESRRIYSDSPRPASTPSSTGWSNFDFVPCRDGKARRIESGSQPLAHGIPRSVVPDGAPSVQEAQATAEERVSRLKGYGNAIVSQVAAHFIQASLEALAEQNRHNI